MVEPTGVERKLAVILAADVEGFTRLMRADEEATLKTLRTYREIIDDLIVRHRGRLFSTAGDSVVAEFASPVEAVRAAIAIQEELRVRNTELPEDRQMRFRIGINLGDVMVEGEDIYGDGVNVAARLEGVAEPGGVCVAGSVFEQVKNKLSVGFEDIGPQEVKNIAEPVPAFRITAGPVSVAEAGKPAPKTSAAPRWRTAVIAAAVIMVVALGGLVIWDAYYRAPPAPPLKPAIAVLPFDNMSGDPKQKYFSKGITEALIAKLSQIPGLYVPSRRAVSRFKSKEVRPEEVARELGVRYVLEGSVQGDGGRRRITAALIDGTTGRHVWAQSYDSKLKDALEAQDEIVQKIVAALNLKLKENVEALMARRISNNPEAYDLYLQGMDAYGRTPQKLARTRQLLKRAVELDPNFAIAWGRLAHTYFREWAYQWVEGPESLDRALELARKAVAVDDLASRAHEMLGWVYLWKKQHDKAIAELERAIALDPNYSKPYQRLAVVLNAAGRPEEAIPLVKESMRLRGRQSATYLFALGEAYWLIGKKDEAMAEFMKSARSRKYRRVRHWLAAIYSEMGEEEKARAAGAQLLKISPGFTIERFKQTSPYKDQRITEWLVDGLRKAGLPEKTSPTAP